jgi:hypothetical protein
MSKTRSVLIAEHEALWHWSAALLDEDAQPRTLHERQRQLYADLRAIPEPDAAWPNALWFLHIAAHMDEAALEKACAFMDELPEFLREVGAEDMSIKDALEAGLIVEWNGDGLIGYVLGPNARMP